MKKRRGSGRCALALRHGGRGTFGARAVVVAGLSFAALIVPATLVCGATLSFGNLVYRGIGPAISGGRTPAVVGSDAEPSVYYAGGADGGVFKSTDGGSTWNAIFDREDAASVGALAVAPRNPNDVWVGTGEANPRNDVQQGDGIWHSSDGGKTWKHLGLDEGGSIAAIAIDPRDYRRLAVAVMGQAFRDNTVRGVYVTSDGGAHWKRTLYAGPSVGASDLVRLPDRPQTLFAGMYPFRRQPWMLASGGDAGGVFRSDDGGRTWHRIEGRGLPARPTGRIGLAAGTGGRLYAIIQSRAGDLWRSDDGGVRWKLQPHSWLVGARPFYFSRIFIDPANNDRLICVGLNLAMSKNGGRSFERISSNAGWDFHVAWWSRDGRRLIVGSDEGVVMSSDGGSTWRQPYDLPFSQVYHVGLDSALPNYHVCIGLQDNNSWCGPANGDSGLGVLNRDWTLVAPGDGMWSLHDPLNPGLVWSTSTNSDTGQVFVWDRHTRQATEVSPDAELNSVLAASRTRYRFNWDMPVAFTNDGKALAGGNVLFESADHGQHWSVISPDLTRNDPAHQQVSGGPINPDMSGAETSDTILCVATSRLDGNLIWVSTDDGLVQVTRDAGAHWTAVTPPDVPHWARMPAVEPGSFDAGTAFVAADNHMLGDEHPYLFMTQNFGATWSSISGDLPGSEFVLSVRQDPRHANLLYAGTDHGVWISWDRGRHWQSLRLNMPASAIYDIEVQPERNDLVIGTHGRGVWVLDDLAPIQNATSVDRSQAVLFPSRDTYRWWQWAPINSFQGVALPSNTFVGPNVAYGALITYWLPRKSVRAPLIDILDSQNHVVRHLKGDDVPNKAGMNRTSWDLQEDGPTKWLGTFKENQGPSEGAEVVPGTYSVRLSVGAVLRETPVTVKPDPRESFDPAVYQRRHDFLAELYHELDGVDRMLNAIDLALGAATSKRAEGLRVFRGELTFVPRNEEDLGVPPGLRDRLMDLINRVSGTSYQAPTVAQENEAQRVRAMYDAMTSRAGGLGLPVPAGAGGRR